MVVCQSTVVGCNVQLKFVYVCAAYGFTRMQEFELDQLQPILMAVTLCAID